MIPILSTQETHLVLLFLEHTKNEWVHSSNRFIVAAAGMASRDRYNGAIVSRHHLVSERSSSMPICVRHSVHRRTLIPRNVGDVH